MIEFCIGYLIGFITVCLFQIAKEDDYEEKKTSNKKKKHRKNKR